MSRRRPCVCGTNISVRNPFYSEKMWPTPGGWPGEERGGSKGGKEGGGKEESKGEECGVEVACASTSFPACASTSFPAEQEGGGGGGVHIVRLYERGLRFRCARSNTNVYAFSHLTLSHTFPFMGDCACACLMCTRIPFLYDVRACPRSNHK